MTKTSTTKNQNNPPNKYSNECDTMTNQRATVNTEHPKHMKAHKSVTSLLTTSNTMGNLSEHATTTITQRLNEINQEFYQNSTLATSTQRLKW